MNLKKTLPFLLLLVGLILLSFFLTRPLRKSPPPAKNAASSSPALSSAKDDKDPTDNQTEKAAQTPSTPSLKEEDLHHWMQENAPSMDSFSLEDQRKLDAFVQSLGPDNMEQLRQMALSLKLASAQRILSVFLLGQSSFGEKALQDFLTQEVPLKRNAPAHSVEETANGREKALRAMALEEWLKKAPSQEEAKKRLAALIPTLKDPWLKDFAQRKLQSL